MASFTRFLGHTHSGASHSVGFLWAGDQPVARDLYLTTHNTHNRISSMTLFGIELKISADERPHYHPLDGASTET